MTAERADLMVRDATCASFLLDLEDQLAEIADPAALAGTACALIARQLGTSQAMLAAIDEDGARAMPEGAWPPSGWWNATMTSGELGLPLTPRPLDIGDLRLHPAMARPQARAAWAERHVLALAAAPIIRDGRPVALLLVAHDRPHPWQGQELDVLRRAADRAWSAIDRRRRMQAALKTCEDRFLRALAGARVGTWDWNMATDEVMTSPGFAPQFHDRPEGSINCADALIDSIHPEDRDRIVDLFAHVRALACAHGVAEYEAEYRIIRRDGEVRWLGAQGKVTVSPVNGEGGHVSGLTVDMSERRRAEEILTATQDRLRLLNADLESQVRQEVGMREQAQAQAQARLAQSQRMEALGQLAGGIAHDFNNVLQAITGGLDLLQRRADRPDAVRQLASRTADAAARGVAITSRLLAFARRGTLKTQVVDVADLLLSLRDLLGPTLGGGITMQVDVGGAVPRLLADRAQLETVLVNLAVNARHAMPDGGSLTVTAHAVQFAAVAPLPPDAPGGLHPGTYICLKIQDTGIGMTNEVLARASEPFFTTKPVEQGTGLGLAMARGFAEQSGGGLALASVLGQGTTATLWFPVASDDVPPDADTRPRTAHLAPRRVMVVDDDDLVRTMLVGQLEDIGYAVLGVDGGAAALACLDGLPPVDIVVTDYAMPGMTGAALIAAIRQRHPAMPILLITGYVDDSLRIDTAAWNPATTRLMRKPLARDALQGAIAAMLETVGDDRAWD